MKSGQKLKIDRQVYWRRNWDEFSIFREKKVTYWGCQRGFFVNGTGASASWYTGHNYHRSDVAGGKLDMSLAVWRRQNGHRWGCRTGRIKQQHWAIRLEAPMNVSGSRGVCRPLGQAAANCFC
ncbi:MAG: hypothetical protein U5L96_14165 [Owenweeksia sp.]|nr:hypothetical protein [Owenweeksia sp.]